MTRGHVKLKKVRGYLANAAEAIGVDVHFRACIKQKLFPRFGGVKYM